MQEDDLVLTRGRRQPVDGGVGEVAQVEQEHAREVAFDLAEADRIEDGRNDPRALQFRREREQIGLAADDQDGVHRS